jgi:hypothetical protein
MGRCDRLRRGKPVNEATHGLEKEVAKLRTDASNIDLAASEIEWMGKWRWFDARYNTRMGGRKRRLRDSKDGAAEVAEVGDSCGLTAKVLLAIEEFVLDQQQQ